MHTKCLVFLSLTMPAFYVFQITEPLRAPPHPLWETRPRKARGTQVTPLWNAQEYWSKCFQPVKAVQLVRATYDSRPIAADGPTVTTLVLRARETGVHKIVFRRAREKDSTPGKIAYDVFELTLKVSRDDRAAHPDPIVVQAGRPKLEIGRNDIVTLRLYGTDLGRGEQHLRIRLLEKGFKLAELGPFLSWSLAAPGQAGQESGTRDEDMTRPSDGSLPISDSSVPALMCELVIVSDLGRLPLRFSANHNKTEIFISRRKAPLEITSFGVLVSSEALQHPENLRHAEVSNRFAVNGSLILDRHPLSLTIPRKIAEEKHVYCYVIVKESDLRSVQYMVRLELLTEDA